MLLLLSALLLPKRPVSCLPLQYKVLAHTSSPVHQFTSSTPNCNPHTPNSKEEQGRILDGNRWRRLDGEGCYKEDSNGGFTGNNDELMNTSAGSGKAKDRVSEDSFLLVSRNSNTAQKKMAWVSVICLVIWFLLVYCLTGCCRVN
jgi:hypothetical protein